MSAWDDRLYALAKHVAGWSKDPGRKVGAVLTCDRGRVTVQGYNGFPRDVPDDPQWLGNPETRDQFTVHAEVNAVVNAARPLTGWSIYVTESPCNACALILVAAGVRRVVCADIRADSRWAESQRLARATLRIAGVEVTLADFRPYSMSDVQAMPKEQLRRILDEVCPVTSRPHDYLPCHGHADVLTCRECGYVPGRSL
jgi:dCMP deaminase